VLPAHCINTHNPGPSACKTERRGRDGERERKRRGERGREMMSIKEG
jgi:hypothetical protein